MGASCVISSVNYADCERFLATKTSDASLWTTRKYYLALAAVCERARTWGHIMENPWRKVKKPKPPVLLPVFFKRDELRTLLAAAEDRDIRELIVVAALTGLRRGELLAMEWDWVDLSRRLLTVKNSDRFATKSKRARVVPLCEDAMTVLLSRYERRMDDGLVFTRHGRPIAADYLSHAFGRLVKRAGQGAMRSLRPVRGIFLRVFRGHCVLAGAHHQMHRWGRSGTQNSNGEDLGRRLGGDLMIAESLEG